MKEFVGGAVPSSTTSDPLAAITNTNGLGFTNRRGKGRAKSLCVVRRNDEECHGSKENCDNSEQNTPIASNVSHLRMTAMHPSVHPAICLCAQEQKDERNKKDRERRKRKEEESQVLNKSATNSGVAPLGKLSNISAADLMTCQLEVNDSSTLHKERSDASHLNITPRRLPFTIINNVAHYGPNEVPMSCVIQTTQNRDVKLRNATLTPEQKQAKVDRQRTRRQALTNEQRLEMNDRRRVARQTLPDVEIHDMNARQRSRRQSVTPGERSAHLARHNELYATRRDKPCAQSIALECPEDCSSSFLNPTPSFETTGDVPATSSLQTELAADHLARSSNFDDDMDSFMDDDTDDEHYMFAGLGDDEDDEMVQSDDDDTQALSSSIPDPFDFVYSNIPQSENVLKPEPDCKHCGAKRFQYEPPGFCCRDGKIKLVENETPPELMRLWTSSDPDAKHFRDNIRYFNGHFSFTTLGVSLDSAFANMSSGVYTFRAHGQIYHNIHSFSPKESGPEHLELYFYDDDPTLSHRFHRSPSLD
ncbi:uncharacterized protein [Oryza sativa Japonica Group]|uniref:uncharacterized protein isoform X2 n=1 Tax=Oryza sativa subsp. japonica TaxID=39947 RepID=UPI0007754C89|nr:uncharacterized protein LOC4333472 isoform X2 [Oryza sativa Japonica Group]